MDLTPIIISGVFTLTCAVIVLYLRDIRKSLSALGTRIDKQDTRIDQSRDAVAELARQFSTHKLDCRDRFVLQEEHIRFASITDGKLNKVTASLGRIEGKLDVTNKLPEICGQIADKISKNINSGGSPHAR